MTRLSFVKKWLLVSPQAGKSAIVVGVLAVALPTILRASLDGSVFGTGLLLYFPFVTLAAMLFEWKAATIIMLVSALMADWLFSLPHHRLFEEPSDLFEVVMFLGASTLIIALVHAIRTTFRELVGPASKGGVFFSLEGDQVWASWPEAGFHLRLGSQHEVGSMMKDFLAQCALAERLERAANFEAPQRAVINNPQK